MPRIKMESVEQLEALLSFLSSSYPRADGEVEVVQGTLEAIEEEGGIENVTISDIQSPVDLCTLCAYYFRLGTDEEITHDEHPCYSVGNISCWACGCYLIKEDD